MREMTPTEREHVAHLREIADRVERNEMFIKAAEIGVADAEGMRRTTYTIEVNELLPSKSQE